MNRLTLTFGVPAAMLLGAAFLRQDPGAGAAVAGPAVAVVDIDKVLKAYPGAIKREQEWVTMNEAVTRELRDLEQQVKQKELLVDGFDKGTVEWQQASLEFHILRLRYEETAKLRTNQAQQKRIDIQVELYDEIRDGIAAFATQQGIDIVLRARDARAGATKTSILEDIQARDLLYHGAKVDVTAPVMNFLKGWAPKPR